MDELLPAPLRTVVANADDPVVVSAAGEANPVERVSGEALWLHGFTTCPRCARVLTRGGRNWNYACGLVARAGVDGHRHRGAARGPKCRAATFAAVGPFQPLQRGDGFRRCSAAGSPTWELKDRRGGKIDPEWANRRRLLSAATRCTPGSSTWACSVEAERLIGSCR